MASRELVHRITEGQTLAPAARSATANGASVDTAGFESATILLSAGTITDGTHTVSVQDSPDGVTFTAVDPSQLIGAFTPLASGAGNGSNSVQEVGYLGAQRYIRAVATVAGATTGGVYEALVVLGHPHHMPV